MDKQEKAIFSHSTKDENGNIIVKYKYNKEDVDKAVAELKKWAMCEFPNKHYEGRQTIIAFVDKIEEIFELEVKE